MAAYPKYNSRVRLSIGYNARGLVDRFGTAGPVVLGLEKGETGVLSGRVLSLEPLAPWDGSLKDVTHAVHGPDQESDF